MNATLTVGDLQQDVRRQLEISQELLDIVRDLQRLRDQEHDPRKKAEIESLLNRLADVGGAVVDNARETGEKIARFASS